MDQPVSFSFIAQLANKYWRTLIVWIFAGLAVSAVLTFFVMTPQYKSSVQILVNRKSENSTTQYADQQADVQMITTYKELITNQVILNPTRKALKTKYGYSRSLETLQNEVAVTSTENSQVFSIDVTDPNAVKSAEIANQIAESFKQQVKKIIKVNNVTIVSKAQAPNSPVKPRKVVNLLIGLVVGALCGLIYCAIKVLTDRHVDNVEFLTDNLKLTNLGIVSHQHHGSARRQGTNLNQLKHAVDKNSTANESRSATKQRRSKKRV